MTTYAWTEHHLIVAPTEAGLDNVVKRVMAVYTADDGAGNVSSQLMNVELDPPDPGDFTTYADLTLIQVIGWIEAKVDTGYWQGYLDDMLLSQTFVLMATCPWD